MAVLDLWFNFTIQDEKAIVFLTKKFNLAIPAQVGLIWALHKKQVPFHKV